MLKRENLFDKLADAISRQIIYNELKSGEIIVETQISKEWGVSRSPVRDALHILKQKGLVEKTPKGSYMIPVLTRDYIENFYDAINMFFQHAFIRATQRITKKELDFFLLLLEKVEKSIGYDDFNIYLEGISTFGYKILQIAQNPIIEKSARDLIPTAERIQFAAYEIEPSYLQQSIKHIRKCYEYILLKDSQQAADAYKNFAHTSKAVLLKES